MSTGYLRWGGWAAVSTAPVAATSVPGESIPARLDAATGDTAGQMQCSECRSASGQAGGPDHATNARHAEQAG